MFFESLKKLIPNRLKYTESNLMNQRRAAEAQSQKRYEKEILCFYAVLCSDNFDSIETDSQGEQRGVK